jgi:hypothetical protein
LNNDGCSSICQLERGYKCTYSYTLNNSVCVPKCGDGFTVPNSTEECDDGLGI